MELLSDSWMTGLSTYSLYVAIASEFSKIRQELPSQSTNDGIIPDRVVVLRQLLVVRQVQVVG